MDLLPVVDPSDYNEQDLRNTFRNLAYFLSQNLDNALEAHPDLLRTQMIAFRDLAAETGIALPLDATVHQANDLLHKRLGSQHGVGANRAAINECIRVGIAVARQGGRRTRSMRTGTGTVAGLFTGSGGVPKHRVEAVEVGLRGVVGDRQAHRQHHGRPFQALCLWSTEVIAALQQEGHPIVAGNAGENVTIDGLEWKSVRPGLLLQLGEVVAEVSSYADPCSFNARWFSDGRFSRIDEDRYPGWGRIYAWVLRPGAIRSGDTVVIEPKQIEPKQIEPKL